MPSSCQPHPEETENEFIVRAHNELADSIPDTDQRNATVFDLWRQHNGHGPLEKKAYSTFDDDRFEHVRDIPVFKEHEYVDRHGETQKYGLEELLAVCDRCNERIDDTGNFAVLSEGHTPTRDQLTKGAKNPPALGFAGPFRLGQIGNRNPRWAIFSDEHWFRDSAKYRQQLPTRSPEVWLNTDMRQRFFDPIAALGSETPRLDMGVRFARLESGEEVEKYSSAAVAPGMANAFTPAHIAGGTRREQYESPTPADPAAAPPVTHTPEQDPMAGEISDEAIQQLVAALMQTDVMQWCKAKMAAEEMGGGDDNQDDMGEGMPGMEDNADPMGQGAGMPPDMGVGDQEGMAPPPPGMPTAGPAGGPPAPTPGQDGKKKYSRASYTNPEEDFMASAEHQELTEKYSRLEAEVTALRTENLAIKKDAAKKERYSRLSALRRTHAFDLRKAVERAESMTDAQFDEFGRDITENYQRIPINAGLPTPIAETPEEEDRERYSRDVARRAEEIVNEQRANGKHDFNYAQGRKLAEAEFSAKGVGNKA
jgi:hypothetical protein